MSSLSKKIAWRLAGIGIGFALSAAIISLAQA